MITISILLAINSIFIVCLTRRFFYTSKQVYEISTTQTRHNASLTNWISIFEKKHNDVPRFVQQCIDNYMQKKYPQTKDDDFDKHVNEVCEKYYCKEYELLRKDLYGRFEEIKKHLYDDQEEYRKYAVNNAITSIIENKVNAYLIHCKEKEGDFDKRVNEVCEKYYCEKYEFLKKHFDDEFLLYNGRWFEKAKKLIIEDRELIRERLENKSNVAT